MSIDKLEKLEFSYESGDRELLVSLLNEYSGKLIFVCNEINKYLRRDHFSFIFIILFLLLSVVVYMAELLKVTTAYSRYDTLFKLTISGMLSVMGFISVFILSNFDDNIQRLKLLKRGAKEISVKLEKVIRLTSQIQEHVVSNLVQRIELNFRLADAESALEHYEITIRKRRFKLYPKKR